MSDNEKILTLGTYEVDKEGILYNQIVSRDGNSVSVEPIANHAPLLQRIVRRDDGFIRTEKVEFRAKRNYRLEDAITIDKKTMIGGQPHAEFSPGCRIFRGYHYTAMYSDFMQMQCENAEAETIYTHTGWIVDDNGNMVFLNGNQSIDKNGLTGDYSVELDPDFKGFQFYPVEDDDVTCCETVLHGIAEAVPDWVYIPLLAYAFLSPLNNLLRTEGKEPCFSLYIIGKTGSYKSSLSKLLLCFFGRWSYADTAPITFLDTQNAVGRKLSVGADLPLLLDDRRPTNNPADKIRYEGLEKFVSSAIGDRAARGRLNADSTAKVSYVAKSNLIVTAEEAFVNIGSSSIARSVSIELQPDTVDFKGLQTLQDKPGHFNRVMQLYIEWIINHYDGIRNDCDNLLRKYRDEFSAAGHARLATAFSQMMFGYAMYLLFMQEQGGLSSEEVSGALKRAKTVFLDMCNTQSKKVETEKPTNLFVNLLREMLETKTVRVDSVNGKRSGVGNTGELIGYKDNTYYYLIPQSTYNQLVRFYGTSGYTFPASKSALWKMMLDEGKLIPELNQKSGNTRTDKRVKIGGKTSRYITIPIQVIEQSEEGENDD